MRLSKRNLEGWITTVEALYVIEGSGRVSKRGRLSLTSLRILYTSMGLYRPRQGGQVQYCKTSESLNRRRIVPVYGASITNYSARILSTTFSDSRGPVLKVSSSRSN